MQPGTSNLQRRVSGDFKDRVPFGRTGFMVSRMGIASGYGVPAAGMERAFYEYGINYFYVSPLLNLGAMIEAVRNLSAHRDELFIVQARPYLGGFGGRRLERYVDRWLVKLGLERLELLLQDVRKPFAPALMDDIRRLQEKGKVRFAGISSHDRPFFPRITRGEASAPSDFFHIRYNAVHTGAEGDIFPHLPPESRPGIGIYTATCWRKLLKPKNMPEGEKPLSAADCYRFVLTNPDVDLCLTAPKTDEQMEENFRALDAGPLDQDEMERARRVGRHLYGR